MKDSGGQKHQSNGVEPLKEENSRDNLRLTSERYAYKAVFDRSSDVENVEEIPDEKAEAGEGESPIEGHPPVSG